MNRGANHQEVYTDDFDFKYFLHLIKVAEDKFDFKLHAYCLMPNHYHLLIETGDESISKIMKKINEAYTRYYNVKYNRDGALFRGRFKSCEVNGDAYFLQTSRYISLNPVKAGIVAKPDQYKWSSYRMYTIGYDDGITSCGRTLNYFDGSSRILYIDFVESGVKGDSSVDKISSDIGEV